VISGIGCSAHAGGSTRANSSLRCRTFVAKLIVPVRSRDRALVDFTRRRIVAGARHPDLAREVRAQADDALALLERGFGGYSTRR
jgi:hypothetical protein